MRLSPLACAAAALLLRGLLRGAAAQACYASSLLAGTGAAGASDGVGTLALFNNPYDMLFGPAGDDLYIVEQQGNRVRMLNTTTQAVITIAGSPTGSAGETDGVGSNALFNNPNGAAIDPACGARGCFYVGAYLGARLRKIDLATRAVSLVAGNGNFANADGLGVQASVAAVRGVALDADAQLLYFTSYTPFCQLRMVVLATGLVGTLSGRSASVGCTTVTSPNGGGTAFAFNGPSGLRYDARSSTLYVAEALAGQIRRVTFLSPGVPNATSHLLTSPLPSGFIRNFALDGAGGNIYIATYALSQSAVYAVSLATGVPVLIAGNLSAPVASVDGVGPAARFNGLVSAAYRPATATLYLAEQVVHKIRTLNLAACSATASASPSAAPTASPSPTACVPGAVTLIAGNTGGGGADGVGTNAKMTKPSGLAIYGDNVFVPAYTANRIFVVGASTNVVTTLAGGGGVTGTILGYVNGVGTNALFYSPTGVCVDSTGTNLYVADWNNRVIRVIAIATRTVTSVAGGGGPMGTLTGYANGVGSAATFGGPMGVGISRDNAVVYVADQANSNIRAINLATLAVTTLAGSPTGALGYANGIGTAALLRQPQGVVMDLTNTVLYVADQGNRVVRAITMATSAVTTLAGGGSALGSAAGFANGIGSAATFANAPWLAIDRSGTLFVADYTNTLVRKIVPSTATVTTVAGNTTGNVLGVGTNARFSNVYGVAVDALDNVFIADQTNNQLKRMASCVSPSATASRSSTPSASAAASATATATRTQSATATPAATPTSSPVTGQSPGCPNGQLPINRTFSYPGTLWPRQIAATCFSFMLSAPAPDPAGLLYYFQVRTNGCQGCECRFS